MAVPGISDVISEIGALLKTEYGPAIIEQVNAAPILWKMFDQSTIEFTGDHWEFPARMVLPQSIGPRPYRTILPTVVSASDQTCKVFHKYQYATFDIAGPDIERARDKAGAFVIGLNDKMNALTKSFIKDCNFQCYLSGTGIYATFGTNGGGYATAGPLVVDSIKYLRPNRRFDFWDDSAAALGYGAANAGTFKIASINPATNAVTFSAAVNGVFAAAANGDSLIPETGLATAATAVGIFLNGLAAIVDDGTNVNVFQNINRTTFPLWKSSIFGNAGSARDLNLDLMQYLDSVPAAVSGLDLDFYVAAPNGLKQYLALLVTQKRFMDDKMDGGFKVLEYNGKKFVVDVDCQDGTVYGLHRAAVKRYGLFEPRFDDTDGKVLKYTGRSGDVFEGFLKMYGNLGTDQPNAHGKIQDITVDSQYRVNV